MMTKFGILALALIASAANAVTVTRTYDLHVGSYDTNQPGAVSPVGPIDALFTVTFDTASNLGPTALGTDFGLSSPYGDNINYAYSSQFDTLFVGQHVDTYFVAFDPGTFGFAMRGASGNAPYIDDGEPVITVDNQTQFYGQDVRLSVVRGGVPEPATWALLVGGFGCVGAAMRRRPVMVGAR